MEDCSKTGIWVELKEFQLSDFTDLNQLRAFLTELEDLYSKDFINFRLTGHGSYEAFEGLKLTTQAEIAEKNDIEYLIYLRLKKKFEAN